VVLAPVFVDVVIRYDWVGHDGVFVQCRLWSILQAEGPLVLVHPQQGWEVENLDRSCVFVEDQRYQSVVSREENWRQSPRQFSKTRELVLVGQAIPLK